MIRSLAACSTITACLAIKACSAVAATKAHRMYALLLLLLSPFSYANSDIHADFLRSAFSQSVPEISTLWLKSETKDTLLQEFDYRLSRLRVRYWQQGGRSAWILDEVGKEQPITMGIVVDNDQIVSIEVLIYRESRGDEIRHSFFRDQFLMAKLIDKRGKQKLNQKIDGITGATLSVRAMKKVAKVALYLHRNAVADTIASNAVATDTRRNP